jgi:hypothetical protein
VKFVGQSLTLWLVELPLQSSGASVPVQFKLRTLYRASTIFIHLHGSVPNVPLFFCKISYPTPSPSLYNHFVGLLQRLQAENTIGTELPGGRGHHEAYYTQKWLLLQWYIK